MDRYFKSDSIVDPLDIVVYHIGGEGRYGPATPILERYAENSLLVVFEARDEASEFQAEAGGESHARKIFINRCISGKSGPAKFYINKFGLSSSMLPPSPRAIDEHPAYRHCVTWGENTELDREVTLETVSFDDLLRDGQLPTPDIFSLDAQGAEYDIMCGAKNTFHAILGVVTEVEFSEIYQGQGLFHQQFAFLLERGIRLADVLHVQYWHPDIAIGKGFLTVGEAVWLRLPESIADDEPVETRFRKLLKLGAISFALGRKSSAYKIARRLMTEFQPQLAELGDHPFWRDLSELHSYVESHRDDYAKDTEYFLRADSEIAFRPSGQTNIDGLPRTPDPAPPEPLPATPPAAIEVEPLSAGDLPVSMPAEVPALSPETQTNVDGLLCTSDPVPAELPPATPPASIQVDPLSVEDLRVSIPADVPVLGPETQSNIDGLPRTSDPISAEPPPAVPHASTSVDPLSTEGLPLSTPVALPALSPEPQKSTIRLLARRALPPQTFRGEMARAVCRAGISIVRDSWRAGALYALPPETRRGKLARALLRTVRS